MEISQEQKARIFAQYLGCKISTSNGIGDFEGVLCMSGLYRVTSYITNSLKEWYAISECQLILTPLSEITDEDAETLVPISGFGIEPHEFPHGDPKEYFMGIVIRQLKDGTLNYRVADELRNRGYCIDESLYTNGIAIKPNDIS